APVIPALADVTGECSATAIAPTVVDNCGATITGTTSDALTYNTQGSFVITWSFDDGNGNVATQTQNVIVDDVTAPVIPALADVTGECSATAIAPTVVDNCGATITGTTSDALTYTTQGSFVITWSFDDGNGNVATQTQNVIVDDVTAPVIPALADVTGECSATAIAPTVVDNCGATITGTTSDPLTYNTQGNFTITWSFDDGNGNVATQTQNVIVDDVTAPVIPALADVTGECSATAIAPTVVDNCGTTITGTTSDALTYNTQGSFVITWSFDDGNGNVATQTQNVIVDDVTAPVAGLGTLPNVIGECSVTSLTAPTATDNCGTVTVSSDASLPITTLGTTVVTWTYDDGNGNTTTQTQNIEVQDTGVPAPVVTNLPTLTGECSVVVATTPTATDGCAGVIVNGITSDPTTYSVVGTYTITWTYTGANTNTTTQTQTVIVTDTTAPVADIATLADVTAECSVAVLTAPTATDNCGGLVTVTNDATLPITAQGTTLVTWTYEDAQGNTSTQT
ncbi:hypothetical protein QWY87_17825, partial [Lutimonas halocynthiae]|uniref:HYR-like domain-containing protein n=1 Tax=Lutimonas halocynthiae TaxID=1446477 RepID=UPI003F4984B8|nr:hypothetical protein [Lutimonas halocynthiae]